MRSVHLKKKLYVKMLILYKCVRICKWLPLRMNWTLEHLNFNYIWSWLNNTRVSTSMYPLGQNTLKTHEDYYIIVFYCEWILSLNLIMIILYNRSFDNHVWKHKNLIFSCHVIFFPIPFQSSSHAYYKCLGWAYDVIKWFIL